MNYRFKELSDNVYVVTLRQGDYLLHLDTRIEDNEFSYKSKIGDVKIKVTGAIQTDPSFQSFCHKEHKAHKERTQHVPLVVQWFRVASPTCNIRRHDDA